MKSVEELSLKFGLALMLFDVKEWFLYRVTLL